MHRILFFLANTASLREHSGSGEVVSALCPGAGNKFEGRIKMKKIALILAVMFAFGVAGCVEKKDGDKKDETKKEQKKDEKKEEKK